MFFKKIALAGSLTAFAASAGFACEIGERVNIVGNEFAAIQAVAAAAKECTGASVDPHCPSNLPILTSNLKKIT